MVLLGTTFFGFRDVFDVMPTSIDNITSVKLQGAEFDTFYVTKDTSVSMTDGIPTTYDTLTVMNAQFENNVEAGNVAYNTNNTSDVLIKRRKLGTFKWLTLFQIKIEKVEDFSFIILDRYNQNKVEYEYASVPIINGAEGDYNTVTIKSSFGGAYLLDSEVVYSTLLNIVAPISQNHPKVAQVTMGSEFPFYISNSKAKYKSGTLSAIWIKQDCTKENDFDIENGWIYRNDLMDYTQNDMPKILKMEDGYIGIVETGTDGIINQSEDLGVMDAPTTSFAWSESGIADDFNYLLDNGFIDVDENLGSN